MTWGQLRFSLQTAAAGVSLDLIDEYLNGRYEQILGHKDWQGLKAHATIVTTAAYQSGVDTAILTVGSGAVTLTGRSFTTAIVGMKFYRPGDQVIYRVGNLVGPSVFTLDRPYEGKGTDAPLTVYPTAAYVLMQNVYPLPTNCASVIAAFDPITSEPMADFDKEEANSTWGPRTLLGDPAAWTLADDTDEQTPPVLHQIEFFPPPLLPRGIPIEYRRSAIGFDGGDTAAAPLPWIPSVLLLEGVKADIAVFVKDYNGARLHEAKYQELLARLSLQDENEVKTKRKLRMASRFTRHRLARSLRGFNATWRGNDPGGPN